MRRLKLVVFAAAMAVSMLAPQSASASAPVRFPSPPPTLTFPGGLFCPFAIFTAPYGSHSQTVTVFTDSAGNATKITFTGSVFVLLENLENGKTIIENASGQGTLIPRPDGSTLGYGSGPGLFGIPAGDPQGPALIEILGHESFISSPPDANGISHITNLVIVGQVTDLCAVLAT